uniref:C2H2-type domain-containing protein n=1 Tax=Acrobeloides nanus TaxID=290746 RepID=A0A914CZD8_9BILA
MKLHESGQRFFCSICGKWFRNMESLQLHTEECMEESEGSTTLREKLLRYKCNYCDKMFHFRRDRAVHERSHTGEKPYTCGYCGRGFTQSQALTIHIRTHTGEKPYTCEYCNGNFRDVSALRKHEYMKHLNEIQLLSSSSANLGHSNTDKTETENVEEILVPEQFDTIPIQEEEFDIPEKLNH